VEAGDIAILLDNSSNDLFEPLHEPDQRETKTHNGGEILTITCLQPIVLITFPCFIYYKKLFI